MRCAVMSAKVQRVRYSKLVAGRLVVVACKMMRPKSPSAEIIFFDFDVLFAPVPVSRPRRPPTSALPVARGGGPGVMLEM